MAWTLALTDAVTVIHLVTSRAYRLFDPDFRIINTLGLTAPLTWRILDQWPAHESDPIPHHSLLILCAPHWPPFQVLDKPCCSPTRSCQPEPLFPAAALWRHSLSCLLLPAGCLRFSPFRCLPALGGHLPHPLQLTACWSSTLCNLTSCFIFFFPWDLNNLSVYLNLITTASLPPTLMWTPWVRGLNTWSFNFQSLDSAWNM